VPADFLLELQNVISHMVSQGPDPRPTAAPRYEFKERFTSLITNRAGQYELLAQHLKPVLRQLIASQMYGLEAC